MGLFGLASTSELGGVKTDVTTAVGKVETAVGQRPNDAKVIEILKKKFGSTDVDLGQRLANVDSGLGGLTTQGAEIKTAVTAIDPRLSALEGNIRAEIQKKRDKWSLKGFLLKFGIGTTATILGVSYLHDHGLDFSPLVGSAGATFNDISKFVGDKWAEWNPPATATPAP